MHASRGRGEVANTAEVATRRAVCQQYVLHGSSKREVRVTDNGPAEAHAFAVEPRRRHCRSPLDELRLADGCERSPAFAVHGSALDEDRVDNVVAGTTDILDQVVGQVSKLLAGVARKLRAGTAVPEMVVRIDDRLLGVDRPFRRACQPALEVLAGDVSGQFGHGRSFAVASRR